MAKFNWDSISKELLEAVGGKSNIKSFQHCATRFRFYVVDDKKVKKAALTKISLAKGVNKEGDQWQVIFGAGTVNKVHDTFAKLVDGGKSIEKVRDPWWDPNLSCKSNIFMVLRKAIRSFADIFIPLIPIFIAGGLSLALSSLVGQISKSNSAVATKALFDLIGGGILGSLPAFIGFTAMKKFGGNPILGLAIGIIMVAPSLLNGWVSSSNYVVVGFGTKQEIIDIKKTQYIHDHFSKIFTAWKAANPKNTNSLLEYAHDHKLDIGQSFAFFPNAPKFFSFSFVGYQAQVFPTIGVIAVAYYLEKFFIKFSHESFAIISVPLGTILISILLGFFFVGPLGRYVGLGITQAFQGIYKYTNWPYFGLGGALLGAAYPFLVVTGLHQGFIPVEASLIAETSSAYGHSFTWITAIGSVSNVAQGMVGFTLAVMLWKKAPKAGSTALSGAISANLGITEPILFGINLPIKYGLLAASASAAVGGYYVGMTHTVANSLGSASWLGLVQFDFAKDVKFDQYIKDYGFHTSPGLDKFSPIANEAIALTITTAAAVGFTLLFSKTFGRKAHEEFVKANT